MNVLEIITITACLTAVSTVALVGIVAFMRATLVGQSPDATPHWLRLCCQCLIYRVIKPFRGAWRWFVWYVERFK